MGIAYDLVCTECHLEMNVGKMDDAGFSHFGPAAARFIAKHAAHDRGRLLLPAILHH